MLECSGLAQTFPTTPLLNIIRSEEFSKPQSPLPCVGIEVGTELTVGKGVGLDDGIGVVGTGVGIGVGSMVGTGEIVGSNVGTGVGTPVGAPVTPFTS